MLSPVDFYLDRQPRYSDYGPSPAIWADCPVLEFEENPGKGIHLYDDFRRAPVLVTPTITTDALYGGGYHAFGSSGGTLLRSQQEGGGGLAFVTGGSDNDGINLQLLQSPFKIAPGKGDLWYEVRAKFASVSDTVGGWFFGLAEQLTLTAIVPITASGTLADKNLVGFHRLEGDGDQIDTVYKADGITQVTVQPDSISTTALVDTLAGSLAADTYIKLGMRFRAANSTLYFFINNVVRATAKVIPAAAGTDFPNDVNLAPVIAGVAATGAAQTMTLSWQRVAQRLVA